MDNESDELNRCDKCGGDGKKLDFIKNVFLLEHTTINPVTKKPVISIPDYFTFVTNCSCKEKNEEL